MNYISMVFCCVVFLGGCGGEDNQKDEQKDKEEVVESIDVTFKWYHGDYKIGWTSSLNEISEVCLYGDETTITSKIIRVSIDEWKMWSSAYGSSSRGCAIEKVNENTYTCSFAKDYCDVSNYILREKCTEEQKEALRKVGKKPVVFSCGTPEKPDPNASDGSILPKDIGDEK